MQSHDLISRLLRGTAFADAYGLPVEGLRPDVITHRYPGGLPVFALVGSYGMASGDTEHAARTAQAFIASAGAVEPFTRALASQLRSWFLSAPPGIGWGTMRALARLSVGVPPSSSGVSSAGNGPCMRAPILGALVPHDTPRLLALVDASSRVTHVDDQAVEGARLVALWGALAVRSGRRPLWPEFIVEVARSGALPSESLFHARLEDVGASLARGETTSRWAAATCGRHGVSAFVGHTVPAVLHLLHHRPRASPAHEWEATVRIAAALGGDTDTVAALVGALNALVPDLSLPEHWAARFRDWPCSLDWLERVALRASEVAGDGLARQPLAVPGGFLALSARNMAFLAVVMACSVGRVGRSLAERGVLGPRAR